MHISCQNIKGKELTLKLSFLSLVDMEMGGGVWVRPIFALGELGKLQDQNLDI